MLYHRQKNLLELLHASGPVGKTKLMKLAFYAKEKLIKSNQAFYDFSPYKYGAYSFQLEKDLSTLIDMEYISKDDDLYSTRGINSDTSFIKRQMSKYFEMNANDLMFSVYNEYPYYTINSIKTSNQYEFPETQYNNFYTIGYEGHSIDSFVNLLIKNQIDSIMDVRGNPISRKFGFSKNILEDVLSKLKIKYVSARSLGVPSHIRTLLDTHGLERYFTMYEDYLKDKADDIEHFSNIINESRNVALLCFEHNANECHRSVLASNLLTDKGTVNL
ncbi:DUF488 family protein [Geovibrio sp. ADMFC3]